MRLNELLLSCPQAERATLGRDILCLKETASSPEQSYPLKEKNHPTSLKETASSSEQRDRFCRENSGHSEKNPWLTKSDEYEGKLELLKETTSSSEQSSQIHTCQLSLYRGGS